MTTVGEMIHLLKKQSFKKTFYVIGRPNFGGRGHPNSSQRLVPRVHDIKWSRAAAHSIPSVQYFQLIFIRTFL